MPKNPPEGMPRVTPYLFYADVGAALDWLEKAFSFERGGEIPGPDRRRRSLIFDNLL